jgi:hypothetical protein
MFRRVRLQHESEKAEKAANTSGFDDCRCGFEAV